VQIKQMQLNICGYEVHVVPDLHIAIFLHKTLIDFLAFLVQKLWSTINKLII